MTPACVARLFYLLEIFKVNNAEAWVISQCPHVFQIIKVWTISSLPYLAELSSLTIAAPCLLEDIGCWTDNIILSSIPTHRRNGSESGSRKGRGRGGVDGPARERASEWAREQVSERFAQTKQTYSGAEFLIRLSTGDLRVCRSEPVKELPDLKSWNQSRLCY